MSTENEIEKCITLCNPDIVMHSNSTYPCPPEDLNLRYITWLKNKYSDKDIGYSGHESGIIPTLATIPLGVTWIERHVTMDKSMWGSDQKASLDIQEMFELVKNIKIIEKSCQYSPQERIQFETENIKKKSLRK
jgi:N-acetylneuraminate synthase